MSPQAESAHLECKLSGWFGPWGKLRFGNVGDPGIRSGIRHTLSHRKEQEQLVMIVVPRYSLADITDYSALFVAGADGEKVLNEASALLINYMQVIGVSELNENNVEDAWLRIATHQAQLGTPMFGIHGQDLYMTRADVLRHVGLRTECANEPIERFWQYVKRRGPEGQEESPFVRANGGKSLLSHFGVSTP